MSELESQLFGATILMTLIAAGIAVVSIYYRKKYEELKEIILIKEGVNLEENVSRKNDYKPLNTSEYKE